MRFVSILELWLATQGVGLTGGDATFFRFMHRVLSLFMGFEFKGMSTYFMN
jgi:hypothetical protein